MKLLKEITQTLTRDSQRLKLTVNVQIELPGPVLQGFIKLGDQICELNYRGTKSKIGDKLGDQKYNFTFKIKNTMSICMFNIIVNFHLLYIIIVHLKGKYWKKTSSINYQTNYINKFNITKS